MAIDWAYDAAIDWAYHVDLHTALASIRIWTQRETIDLKEKNSFQIFFNIGFCVCLSSVVDPDPNWVHISKKRIHKRQ